MYVRSLLRSELQAEKPFGDRPGLPIGRDRMKTSIKVLVAASSFVIVASVSALGAVGASASNRTTEDGGTVVPAVVSDGHSFYTDDQVDDVWRAVTRQFPDALPPGIRFPTTAPAFFHPEDGLDHYFETGLPDQMAARFWRCAWLDSSINDAKAGKTAAISAASKHLKKYSSMPGMYHQEGVESYDKAMSDYAATIKLDPASAEFSTECGDYVTAEAGK